VLIFRNYEESQILWFAHNLKITDTLRVSHEIGLVKTCVILPNAQAEANSYLLHIP